MDNHAQQPCGVKADCNPTLFFFAVLFIKEGKVIWVTKYGGRLPEREASVTDILPFFDWIPIKLIAQISTSSVREAFQIGW
jgi:hypothetical protein